MAPIVKMPQNYEKTEVFARSESHEKGHVDPKRGLKRAKIAQDGPKLAQVRAKMGQDRR